MKSLYESILKSTGTGKNKYDPVVKRVIDYLLAERSGRASFVKDIPSQKDFDQLDKLNAPVWEPQIYTSYQAYEKDWWITEFSDIVNLFIKHTSKNCSLNWIDMSKVKRLNAVFYYSEFNGDISKWNTSNIEDMSQLFRGSKFNGDISKWDVSNVKNMEYMFCDSEFNGDISKWKIKNGCRTDDMFINCPIKDEYKPKILK